ncbi:MAG: OsmC family protein [Planctomycetota bacterium]|nr:OsmC family protein [Planctomycetota bacterium]MDA0931980.1 OsmC family protein [Planctomycetota bacterium]MDA1221791.1 OsmC family protein [Planctomycetota bacterium]
MSQELHVTLGAGRRVTAHVGGFEIHTDQSAAHGGQGTAPEPFDLFLASIGACAGAYISGFCAPRDIPVDGIRLVQSWERNEDQKVTRVSLRIELPESFPDKYRGAILRVVDKCSVKKALAEPPQIDTEIVTSATR